MSVGGINSKAGRPHEVLRNDRKELRTALGDLAGGRLTTSGFCELFWRLGWSRDLGVIEIGAAWFGLCDNEFQPAYCLVGEHALDSEMRACAERCDLFLRTNLPYECPPEPHLGWVELAKVFVILPGLLLLLPIFVMAMASMVNGFLVGPGLVLLGGILLNVPGALGFRALSRYERRCRSEFQASGQRELWPFASVAQLEQARRQVNSFVG
jgi:hypothetical protein